MERDPLYFTALLGALRASESLFPTLAELHEADPRIAAVADAVFAAHMLQLQDAQLVAGAEIGPVVRVRFEDSKMEFEPQRVRLTSWGFTFTTALREPLLTKELVQVMRQRGLGAAIERARQRLSEQ